MEITYKIDPGTFTVEIFSSENEAPFLYQPDWPTGEAWASLEEATEWTESFIAHYKGETDLPPKMFRDDVPQPIVAEDPAPEETPPAE